MEKIIEVHKLEKSYGSVHAVRGLDFYVEKGTLFSFLGVNGAGKSTTIDILCTLTSPDKGDVTIDGYTLGKQDDEIRKSIGVVFQDGLLDKLLTVKENLKLRGALYGLSGNKLASQIDWAVAVADCGDFLTRPYGKLSGGQRRRADIARALINAPKILFLDEPTTGLDPQTRQHIWETVRRLQSETKMTVFLTTHYMEEAAISDYITIIGAGKLLAKGTPVELKQCYASDTLKLKPKNSESFHNEIKSRGLTYTVKGEYFCIPITSTLDALPIAEQFEGLIENLEILNGTMDDVFLNVAGGALV